MPKKGVVVSLISSSSLFDVADMSWTQEEALQVQCGWVEVVLEALEEMTRKRSLSVKQ